MMPQQDRFGDFVIATGETHSAQEFLERTFDLLELGWRKYLEEDPRYLRPAEVDVLQGNTARKRSARALVWLAAGQVRAPRRKDGRVRPRSRRTRAAQRVAFQ
jgi:GDP-D-mannose dehydratase